MKRRESLFVAGLLALAACDGNPNASPDGSLFDAGRASEDAGTANLDAGVGSDAGTDSALTNPLACPRLAAPADRVRHVVVSHHFDELGGRSDQYEVLELGEDGALSRTDTFFHMGHSTRGEIAFTPDGEIGVVAQSDDSLGVFRLDESGMPTTIHSAFSGDFYASSVVMDPSGEFVWILDTQWREHGGGLHRARIGCDGRIASVERIVPAKLAYGMRFAEDHTAIMMAHDALDVGPGPDVYRIDLATPSILSSSELFPDMDWIGGGFALSANERHVFAGDNASFSETGNRIGVAEITASEILGVQTIPDVEDPVAIVASPFDDAVIVTSGFGDAIFVFDYARDAALPLTARGALSYSGAGPQLPGAAVLIDRGMLRGLVLVAEHLAIRRIRFEGAGVVEDLGSFSLGTDTADIVGALGVTP